MKLSPICLLSLLGSAVAFTPSTFNIARSNSNTELYGRKPFISGNWKLNPQTKDEAVTLADEIAKSVDSDTPECDVALFVPYVFIEATRKAVDGKIMVGAEVRQFGHKIGSLLRFEWIQK